MRFALRSRWMWISLLIPQWLWAGSNLKDFIARELPVFETLYQDLHRHPELSGQEMWTASRIAGELRALHYDVQEKIGGTGVAAVLQNGAGPVTMIRAELDGLPVLEETNLSYQSQIPGVMHACGHDLHMTALVGVAKFFSQSRNLWRGTLIFVAQPAEETAKGALAMVKDGFFDKIPHPDQILSLHISGGYPQGQLTYMSGYAMANVDSIDIKFIGRGAHGSTPFKAIDPLIMAAEFVLRVQTLIGREVNPHNPAVISVGSIHGGTKHNIIPNEVNLQLTVRTFDPKVRALLMRRISEMANGVAEVAHAPAPVIGHPEWADAVVNPPEFATKITDIWRQKLPSAQVKQVPAMMGSEDFGVLTDAAHVPGFYYFIGTYNQEDDPGNHSSRYAPDFAAVAPIAIESMATAVLSLHAP